METLVSLFFVLIFSNSLVLTHSQPPVLYNVLDHGAIGDGRTDDTDAFGKAWDVACSSSSSFPTMHVPGHKTFFIHPLHLNGPCKSQNINVQINGNIIAPRNPSDWRCIANRCNEWIYFNHVNGLSVYGSGTINGQGDKWWEMDQKNNKPTAMKISHANNVQLSGITFKNNPQFNVLFHDSNYVYISDIKIDSPGHSRNTDGIHIGSSTNFFIDHCTIRTGDDCISIGGGSSYLQISNITCGPGHGISIGSLGHQGSNDKVEYVEVRDVVFTGSTNGARIKTWQGGNGYARHILFERILTQGANNPIIIDQSYCPLGHCETTQKSAVQVNNVTYREIVGTSRNKRAVTLDCSDTVPCTDIVMDNIYIRTRDGKRASALSRNAHGTTHGQTVPDISLA